MTIFRFPAPGQLGAVKDVAPAELAQGAWSDALNVRFLDGHVEKMRGHWAVYGSCPITPYFLVQANIGGAWYWAVAGAAKVYAVSSGPTWTNITRQTAGSDVDFTATPNAWTGGNLSGIPILNPGNETDLPQMWNPVSTAQKITDLTAWPAATYCKAMRPFKSFLVALNVTKAAGAKPYMVKWSHPAEPGTVPASWDETDATKQAGEVDLAATADHVVDGLQLGDRFVIYKENSTWAMDFVGGNDVFRFSQLFQNAGILARNAVCEFDGKHLVVTRDDIIVHDGQTKSSVVDKAWRRWFFANMDNANNNLVHVAHHKYLGEIWINFPLVGSTTCDRALIYNYLSGTITLRALPNVHCAASGYVADSAGVSWSAATTTWATVTTAWNESDYPPNAARLLLGAASNGLFSADAAWTFNGTAFSSYVERTGLHFGEPESFKLCRGVRPRISGQEGAEITVSIGAADEPDDDPTYTDTTYVIGTTGKIDCLVTGRYLAVKFANSTADDWRLDGFDMDVLPVGGW